MATQHKSKSSDHADHLRDITGAGAEQSREFLQKVGNVTSEAANAMQNCCSTGLKGMQEYHSKLLELTQRNAQSYFDFAQKLAVAKTPAQFFEMSTEHTRH